MAQKTFNLPDPGEGLTEADLVTWRVAVGDVVKVNDMVVEVETAKSLVELPIPFAGTVIELLAAEGDTVEVGSPIIVVETGEGDEAAAAAAPAASEPDSSPTPQVRGRLRRPQPRRLRREGRLDPATGAQGRRAIHPFARDVRGVQPSGEQPAGRHDG